MHWLGARYDVTTVQVEKDHGSQARIGAKSWLIFLGRVPKSDISLSIEQISRRKLETRPLLAAASTAHTSLK